MNDKMTLEFNVQDPDAKQAALRAMKATEAYLVIHSMFQELRKDWKYSEDATVVEHAERYRDILNGLCDQYSINLDAELS